MENECNHILGVEDGERDLDSPCYRLYQDSPISHYSPDMIFKFCPECGISLKEISPYYLKNEYYPKKGV